MKTIRIGIIGLGHWGPNHLRVFSSLKESTVVAASDKDPRRLQAVRDRTPGLRAYESATQLLADPDVDAVVVATPTATHYAVVKESLNAGKHVLCEKPLCLKSSEGEELVALAASRKLVLMVGHIFLFNAGILKVKEVLESGELGDLHYLHAVRTNLGPVRSDVNAAFDLASHDIAVFNWLLGAKPAVAQAMGAAFIRPTVEDVVMIGLRYPNNVMGTVQSSWLDPKKVRQMTIVGSRKMLTWDDLALANSVAIYEKAVETQIDVNDYGEFLRLSMREGEVRMPRVATSEPLRTQNLEFLHAISEGRRPRSDGEFANEVVRVLEAVEQSMQAGRRSREAATPVHRAA